MTKKRKRYPDLNQKLERPWCYYCERDFDDLKILISHQKAKHFKCDRCGRRLNTAGGLSVHMNQVHKENLTHVENAIPGRQGLEVEIFGMEGVPAEIVDQHNQQVTQQHFAEEAERARVTGNPVRGLYSNGQALPNKRTKVKEPLEELEQNVGQFRIDRANGVIPKAPEVQPTTQTPPAVQPYGPPSGAPVSFPPQAPFGMPPRPGSIPGQPPGALPPRPAFAATPGAFPPGSNGLPPDTSAISASLDDLIGEVRKEAVPETEKKEDKKSKKDKNVKLVYSHDSLSPEERMATLPRFAEFVRA